MVLLLHTQARLHQDKARSHPAVVAVECRMRRSPVVEEGRRLGRMMVEEELDMGCYMDRTFSLLCHLSLVLVVFEVRIVG